MIYPFHLPAGGSKDHAVEVTAAEKFMLIKAKLRAKVGDHGVSPADSMPTMPFGIEEPNVPRLHPPSLSHVHKAKLKGKGRIFLFPFCCVPLGNSSELPQRE